jgi:DNA-binding transcriptional ArsR family regulator
VEKSSSSDYFGSFLETVKQSPTQATGQGAEPLRMLRVLEESGPVEASKLQSALGLDLLTFSKELESMTDAKLVQVSGEPGQEIVSLTEQGHTLASMQASSA